jgi:diguanylate cyclase (GGDEF)-like protein/PAS domain S-box-containing protein
MEHRWTTRARRGLARVSRGRLASGLLALLVVLAMVASTDFSRQTADLHRRAQVLAERFRASSQEMSALKWRANEGVVAGTADLSFDGSLVRKGAQIVSNLDAEVAELQRLQPGPDAERLLADVQQLYMTGMQQLTVLRGPQERSSLASAQRAFQPILDRMDTDAQRTADRQQAVAGRALKQALWGSIASLLLGLVLLGALGWRLSRLRRRTELAEEVRAVERRSEQRIRALVEHSSDVVTVLGRDLCVRWQAASIGRLLGHEPGSLIEAPITSIVHPDDQELFDGFLRASFDGRAPSTLRARMKHVDGRWCHVETVAENRFSDPAVEGLVLNMRDISERKAFEDELRHQAFHDALTGLANRALFENRLRHALAGGVRTHRILAVLFLDIDDFKTINDSLGHRAGDELLCGVAGRIDALVRATDTAARLGGDEFAVLVDGVANRREASEMAERILDAVRESFVIDGRDLSVTASIGIALSTGEVDADELLRNADMAMYAAKAAGKDSVHSFERNMHRRAVERLEMRTELQRAIESGEFVVDYQPIVSLQNAELIGVEALVRWMHPSRGLLGPDQFIPLAEETGAIVPLGKWVLERACTQLTEWERALHASLDLCVTVNVSIRQLQEDDFPDAVAAVLERTKLRPRSLVLEITEGLLADDRERIIRRLVMLKRLGLRIAIDDFGTGYSALSHLQQFPIDILKIDKSFVDGLDADAQKANLVQGIINLGASLQLDVIAEGIEQEAQAARLREMRSPLGQGYLFSRPVPPDDVLELLRGAETPSNGTPERIVSPRRASVTAPSRAASP